MRALLQSAPGEDKEVQGWLYPWKEKFRPVFPPPESYISSSGRKDYHSLLLSETWCRTTVGRLMHSTGFYRGFSVDPQITLTIKLQLYLEFYL